MMLALDQVMFERDSHVLFQQINETLHQGELLQIRGTNGSGKSTLLRILAGFMMPENGDVIWQGQSIFQQRERYQQHVHYIGHHNGIKPTLTVYENLKLLSAVLNISCIPSHLEKIVDYVKLHSAMHVQTMYLSAGQQRRLSLARLLLHPRLVWILDEPMTALDGEGQNLLGNLLNRHLEHGGIAAIATHHALALKNGLKTIELGRS